MISKRILIMMPSMARGGTEISLLNFLNAVEALSFDITLLLLEDKGEMLSHVPSWVHQRVVEFDIPKAKEMALHRSPIPWLYRQWSKVCWKTGLFPPIPYGYRYALRHCNVPSEEEFDLAIDYHGYGCFCAPLLVEKIHARHKAVVVHGDNLHGLKTIVPWLRRLDSILEVTVACQNLIRQTFPFLKASHFLFPNQLDYDHIRKLSESPIEFQRPPHGLLLCTVGRMESEKGFDLAVDAGKLLREKGVSFTWVFVGDGSQRPVLERMVADADLRSSFVFAGMQQNPYPYMRMADLYVQPSRNEGYGLAIEEAQTVGTPVIASDLPAIKEHVADGVAGRLVQIASDAFANAIADIAQNPDILNRWRQHLVTEMSSRPTESRDHLGRLLTEMTS